VSIRTWSQNMNAWPALPLGLTVVLLVVGCGGNDPTADPLAPSGASSAAIAAAIADPRRPATDVARDAARKPKALLEFAGIAPGMNVLDMFAGGGYYTELAAYVVGPTGKVVAYNNTGYSMVAAKQIESRYADGRLSSVEQLTSENNETELPASTFDVVLLVLAYHDVYYLDGERGWALIDRPRLLKEVFDSVKPGGRVIVVDHIAPATMPAEQVRALHRIDPALIKADFQAAGFRFDAESDVLRNPDDDLNIMAMAPQVRGKTDRAVLRFVKT
jgi:predicted methyltransferase